MTTTTAPVEQETTTGTDDLIHATCVKQILVNPHGPWTALCGIKVTREQFLSWKGRVLSGQYEDSKCIVCDDLIEAHVAGCERMINL